MDIPPIVTAMIGSAVRHGLTTLCGGLVLAGYLSQDQSAQVAQLAAGIVGIGLTVLWSWLQDRYAKQMQLLAQIMPAGTTETELAARIAAKPEAVPSVMTQASAVPEVLPPPKST